ncbi:MAG TPA: serine/threonine protein phosphatase [Microscillaceae bacterium]|nr:serine/threonine protein phosphatase [Microscillaceae bacterium]
MNKQWVIADIHGCYKTFVNLLEYKVQLSQEDQLFLLGDYIDRGTGSKEIIDYIQDLQESGYKVYTLRGNHEDVLLRCYWAIQSDQWNAEIDELYKGWLRHGGTATLKSFGVTSLDQIPSFYIQFLENLRYYYLTDQHVLVHAGLNFRRTNPFLDIESMLWIKNFAVEAEKIENRRLVHGHDPKSLDYIKQCLNNRSLTIPLDNGCIYEGRGGMGNLLALELHSNTLEVQRNVEYKPMFLVA